MDAVIPGDWRELYARERDVLVAIALEGPGNGVEIHQRIEGSRSMDNRPSTYRNLGKLEDHGYVSRRAKNRNEYEYYLTDAGRDLLGRAMVKPAHEFEVADATA